jgi:predicted RNA-binding protein with PUA-like domain
MARWLFKEEPDTYSYADLERDGEAVWSGVRNPLARKHLRAVAAGDEVFFYHTGKEKAVVGVMRVSGGPEPDPSDESLVTVRVKPARRLAHPVPLSAIKADPAFAGWELVRLGRLSVMPVPDAVWKRVEELAKKPAEAGTGKKKPAG